MAEVTHDDVERELTKLEKQVKNFRIIGGGAHGKFEMGFVLGKEDAVGGGGGGSGGTTPPTTGACCMSDNSCEVLTAADCAAAGGTYQGDGTPCDPNPCGACPRDDFLCIVFESIVSCGCVGLYEVTDIISTNGTFELTKVADSGSLVDWQGLGGMIHIRQYEFDGCTGAIINEADIQLSIEMACDDVDGYTLNYYFFFGDTFFLMYEAFNDTGNTDSFAVGTPIPNKAVCGGIRLGNAGTATITLGPCS